MEYNTTRNKLIIPEYGRNVQKMVEFALTLPDRNERTRFSHLIVSVMGQINPQGSSSGDHLHKLWDHLYYISDFRLDVDSPYSAPEPQIIYGNPAKVEYSTNQIEYRHYGKNISRIIQKAIEFEEGPEKEELIRIIATHMKKSYLTWNRESVNDQLIVDHLKELSGGKLILADTVTLASTNDILTIQKRKSTKSQVKNKDKGRIKRKR